MYSLLADIFILSLMPVTFEIVQMSISIHNAIAIKILSDSHKYFIFYSNIYSILEQI